MVDGYAGFLFLDKNDKPMLASHWEKYLEYIMGHSYISVTLNTYTHVQFEDTKDELKRVAIG